MIITINKQEYKAAPGETILQVAAKNKIFIPTMCHNEELTLTGACGLCVVEIEGIKRLLRACATPVSEGMAIHTDTKRVTDARKTVLELTLSTHTGDCQAPCRLACPAETDCQGYIRLIAEGKTKEAVALMKEAHPFPASLARICPRPCETNCRRKWVDEAVNIAGIKRYAADIHLQENVVPSMVPENGKHIAIIGGGPGGLTAAYFLRRGGFAVTVFEKMPKMGGLLQYGIPEYRLPKKIIDAEIKLLEDMGVTFKNNAHILSLIELQKEHSAVIIATGAHKAKPLWVKGEDSSGVIGGIDFLKAVAEGNAPDIGKKVIVVGGSNTAMDAARTARRLGAEVLLSYRRTKNEMPAGQKEIEEAITEGVEFLFLTAPKEIKPGLEITLERMTLGEPDESGRRKPIPISGQDMTLQANTIIAAIGQDITDLGFDLTTDEHFRTNMHGVYAIGDVTGKSSYAIDAISHGRKVAASVLNTIDLPWDTIKSVLVKGDKTSDFPHVVKDVRENEVHVHSTDFSETVQGLTAAQVKKETARCLSCGCSAYKKCELINLANKYGSNPLRFSYGKKAEHKQEIGTISRNINKCIHCYQCVKACEKVGKSLFTAKNRGFACFIDTAFNQPLPPSCKDCMECVNVCPTGALS